MASFKDILKSFNPTKYTITDRTEHNRLEADFQWFNKQYLEQTTRPANPLPYLSTDSGAKVPIYPIPPVRLYEIADYIPDVRTVIDVIQKEMFKNGFEVRPKFQYRCTNCGQEYEQKPLKKPDATHVGTGKAQWECDVCFIQGENNFETPSPGGRAVLQELLDRPCNSNGQTIVDVARQYERDLDIVDNAYCVVLKKYFLKPGTTPEGATKMIDEEKTEISEFLRVHPAQVAFIADSDGRIGYDDNHNKVYICPDYRHRNQRLSEPVCPKCGCKAIKAIVEVNSVFSIGIVQPKRVYYGEGELIWTAGKYEPDILYGFSPLISIWRKAVALMHMDEYILKYFDKQRPPRSLLVINSRNFESVNKAWERLRQGARDDPSLPRPLLVENEKGGAKNAVEHVDLIGNLKDLEFIEVRKEFRQAIFAAYGFPPFLFGQVDKGGFGGANMQITETNRTISAYQMFLKRMFFDPVCHALGINDWILHINEGEETDKMRDVQLMGMKIENASKLHNELGMDVVLDGNGEPQSSQVPNPAFIQSNMGSGMGPKKGDSTNSTAPDEEEDTKFQGEIHSKRPSDVGGSAQGDPNNASSLSNKSLRDKALDEEEVDKEVHYTLLKGIENGWTQTNIAKKIAKYLPTMTEKELVRFVRDSFKYGIYRDDT